MKNNKIYLAVTYFIFWSQETLERSLVSSPEFYWEGTWTQEKEVGTYSGFLSKPVTENEPLLPNIFFSLLSCIGVQIPEC